MAKTKITIGISGASGSIFGIRILQVLAEKNDVEANLVISRGGEITVAHEAPVALTALKSLADNYYRINDIGAPIASGSHIGDGMVIAPCSMKTLSAVANSYGDNLLTRAADVTLKERRKLVLMVRETPLHLGHLRLMTRVAEIGGIIMPPVPAFYSKPQTIDDIVDHLTGKVLDVFGIDHNLIKRWKGLQAE